MKVSLSTEDIDSLKACGIGQGLVQVNNTVTAVNFSLTDLESRVILGTGDTGIKTGHDSGFKLVDDRLAALAMENNAYLDDWIDGDAKVLSAGRDSFPVQRAFRGGTTRMWVKSSIVENGRVLNQSIDHYGMVLQIASYLLHKGFSVEVNHHDDADIVATMNGHTIAIEYERPGTHTIDQLIEKKQRLQTRYGRVVFVVTSTNFKMVSADNCIGMEKTVTIGLVLKEYLENLVHEFKRLKQVNQ